MTNTEYIRRRANRFLQPQPVFDALEFAFASRFGLLSLGSPADKRTMDKIDDLLAVINKERIWVAR